MLTIASIHRRFLGFKQLLVVNGDHTEEGLAY